MTKELDCLIAKIAQEITTPELHQIISALNFQLQQREEKRFKKQNRLSSKRIQNFANSLPMRNVISTSTITMESFGIKWNYLI